MYLKRLYGLYKWVIQGLVENLRIKFLKIKKNFKIRYDKKTVINRKSDNRGTNNLRFLLNSKSKRLQRNENSRAKKRNKIEKNRLIRKRSVRSRKNN